MSELLQQTERVLAPELPQAAGRITVLEALAEAEGAVGPSRSNISTNIQGDPDDQ